MAKEDPLQDIYKRIQDKTEADKAQPPADANKDADQK